ncbi:hypothetical protein SAMN04487785_102228 [Dyella jiangningensis]|uniref:hypothetical protein n=1 Tax=Dyella sp. AtDHG13 TaxID=1938897 RepID=UPI00088363DB|nr:hypothetical protein [Dyella sp. AtDHG13]PXV60506.1 hypothetical protein BDW41_102228 [Dyella sp. AtDHG13]SDJ48199.1 hypothetical protein SAMN04487785_102228 [Dyella jiangningensis]
MQNRSLRQNTMPGLFAAGLAILVLGACSPSSSQSQDEHAAGAAAPAPAATVAAPAPASTAGTDADADADDAVIEKVSAVIRKHKLTSLSDECLDYMVDDSDGATIDIDVHEKHDAKCGGDPNTSPRLFSFKLDRASGQLTTDALDLADGDFQPIQ